VESGEVREVHQICCLLGYGTDAVAPYMVFEIVQMLREENILDQHLTDDQAYTNYKGAVDRGISKIMAKMGISVLQSYKGAQIFEAVGLAQVRDIEDRPPQRLTFTFLGGRHMFCWDPISNRRSHICRLG